MKKNFSYHHCVVCVIVKNITYIGYLMFKLFFITDTVKGQTPSSLLKESYVACYQTRIVILSVKDIKIKKLYCVRITTNH